MNTSATKLKEPGDDSLANSHIQDVNANSSISLPQEGAATTSSVNLRVLPKTVYKFLKVKDARGREIFGLWERNRRFYYQLSIPGKGCRRIPLVDEENQSVRTVTEAEEAIYRLRKKKRDGDLPTSQRAPAFDEYAQHYLSSIKDTEAKKPKTIWQEKSVLKGWAKFLGGIRITKITRKHISDYVLKRKQQGVGNRTVNIDVLVLSNCLKFAKDEGLLQTRLPMEGWKRLAYRAPKRPLFTRDQFEHLCRVAIEKNADDSPKFKNGEMLADAIHFMMFSGARVTSALATLWSNVSWDRRQVELIKTKYSKTNIVVDFNGDLEALLKEMHTRRVPDSDYMFPGTRTELNVVSLRKTFELVREAAGLPNLHFHDTRHYFISSCVASGVDLCTIAAWVGHEGIALISKVYAHLSSEVAQRAAKKVSFGTPTEELKPRPTQSLDISKLTAEELLEALRQIHSKNGQKS